MVSGFSLLFLTGGTEGSNPAPSSGESRANLYFLSRASLMAAVASGRTDSRHRDLGETVDAFCRAAE